MPMPVCRTCEVMLGRFFCSHCVTASMFFWLTTVGNWCWRLRNHFSALPLLTQATMLCTSCES